MKPLTAVEEDWVQRGVGYNEELFWGDDYDKDKLGVFVVTIGGIKFRVIAKQLIDWDHVTVLPLSGAFFPAWGEMEAIKRAFFLPEECAMQLHVPVDDHLSTHPYLLHLWRPRFVDIPRPWKGIV